MEYLIGQKFGDRYTIREKIGEGGMAVVFQAWDHTLETEVALKVMRSDLADDGDIDIGRILEKFELEIRCVVGINHPHIVPILDRGEQDGVFYYAMRYVKGGSLSERLTKRGGPLAKNEVLAILSQVGGALQRAHDAGLYHRDIKPSNILYEENSGEVDYFLADFGIAKAVEDTSQQAVTLTSSGTPGYMSPEQAFGDPFDHRTDVFSLGVATYELVTGVRPFRGTTLTALMRAVTTEDAAPPTSHNATLPKMVSDVILKAMERTPGQRYASVRDFVSAMELAYEGVAETFVGEAIQRPNVLTKRWWPVAVGVLAVGVITTLAIMSSSPPDKVDPSTTDVVKLSDDKKVLPQKSIGSTGDGEKPEDNPDAKPKDGPKPGPNVDGGGVSAPPVEGASTEPVDAEPLISNSPNEGIGVALPPVPPPPTGIVVAYGAETGDGLVDALRTIASEFVQEIVKSGTEPTLLLLDQETASDPVLRSAKLRQMNCELVVYLHASAPKNVGGGGSEAQLTITVRNSDGRVLLARALPQTDSNPAKNYKVAQKRSAYVSSFRRALAEVASGGDNPPKLTNVIAPEVVKALQKALNQD